MKEGSPTTPDRRRSADGGSWASDRSSAQTPAPRSRSHRSPSSAGSPRTELAIVEAADLFNAHPVPPDGRRDREEPRPAAGLRRPALGRQPRDRDHDRLGSLLVPVPRHARLGQPVRLEERGHEPGELDTASWSGTRGSRTTAASSRRSPASKPRSPPGSAGARPPESRSTPASSRRTSGAADGSQGPRRSCRGGSRSRLPRASGGRRGRAAHRAERLDGAVVRLVYADQLLAAQQLEPLARHARCRARLRSGVLPAARAMAEVRVGERQRHLELDAAAQAAAAGQVEAIEASLDAWLDSSPRWPATG